MRVLVTGAGGFVGSTLCEQLRRRDLDVRALVRPGHSRLNLLNFDGSVIEGDLHDPDSLKQALEGVSLVYHLAGTLFSPNRDGYFLGNQVGTRNLLQEAKRAEIKRFVYVSSLAAAGPSIPGKPRVESETPEPISNYGASKLAGEQEVLKFKDYFPVTIVRPPSVYGPRDKATFTFFDILNKGILPLLGLKQPSPQRYSFVHVSDLVQGLIRTGNLTSNINGEIFYISGDHEYSWEDFMVAIANGMEKKALRVRIPIPLMHALACGSTVASKISGKSLPLTLDKIREMKATAWSCSNQKAKTMLDFEPEWSLAEGAAQTYRWYRDNGWL